MTKRGDADDGASGSDSAARGTAASIDERFASRYTLTFESLPLMLPGESFERVSSVPPSAPPGTGDSGSFDAWTVDKIERSSLPVGGISSSSFPPPSMPPAITHVEQGDGDALALAGRSSGSVPPLDLTSEIADRFALGDYSGSLRAAELVLGQDPNHELARHYARESHDKLEGFYRSRLEANGVVPRLLTAEDELRWLGFDSQIGAVLSRVDGVSDYHSVIAASGLPVLAALRALVELMDAKVVRLG